MKRSKAIFTPFVAAALMVFAFTACQKKVDDSQNFKAIRGNVNTDGINVLSSSTLNGKALNMSISNVVKVSDATNTGSLVYSYTTNKSVMSMDIYVNGLMQRVQMYNSIYGEGYKSQVYMNGFVVYFESRCLLNTNCNEFVINAFIGDQSGSLSTYTTNYLNQIVSSAPEVQWKQLAILKTFASNTVGVVFEQTTTNANLQSTDQAIQTLLVIRANT